MKHSTSHLRFLNEGSGYPTSNWKLEGSQETTNALIAAYEAATGPKKQELYSALLFLNAFNGECVNNTPDPVLSPTTEDKKIIRRNDYMSQNDILNFAKTREIPDTTPTGPEDALITLIDLKREYEKELEKKNRKKKKTKLKDGN